MKLNTQEEALQALLEGKTVHGKGRKYKILKGRVCVYSDVLQRWEPSVVAFYGDGYYLEKETEVLYKYAYSIDGAWSETQGYYTSEDDILLSKDLGEPEQFIRLDYTKLEVEK